MTGLYYCASGRFPAKLSPSLRLYTQQACLIWSIGGMQSVFWNTEAGKRNLTGEHTFYVEKEIIKQWNAFAEYAGDFAQWGGSKQIAHLGTAYRVTPRQQADFHFGLGLCHTAPGRFFAVGYSFRIDRGWRQ